MRRRRVAFLAGETTTVNEAAHPFSEKRSASACACDPQAPNRRGVQGWVVDN